MPRILVFFRLVVMSLNPKRSIMEIVHEGSLIEALVSAWIGRVAVANPMSVLVEGVPGANCSSG